MFNFNKLVSDFGIETMQGIRMRRQAVFFRENKNIECLQLLL